MVAFVDNNNNENVNNDDERYSILVFAYYTIILPIYTQAKLEGSSYLCKHSRQV